MYNFQAFLKTQLSPGSNSLKFAKKMDKRILSLKGKQKTREYKKKRIEKKEKRLKKTKQLENREGQQYSSGMGFNGDHAAQEIPAPPAASKIERVHYLKTTIQSYLIWKHLEGVIILLALQGAVQQRSNKVNTTWVVLKCISELHIRE